MKRYYYHIRQSGSWGEKVTLEPRADGPNRNDLEPDVPRICVAPTIAQCIVALGNIINARPIYVYRTAKKLSTKEVVEPWEVPDAMITDEAWIVEPCEFVFDRVITSHCYYNAPTAGSRAYDYLLAQDNYLKIIKKDFELQCP
jgi:hypothetical protein